MLTPANGIPKDCIEIIVNRVLSRVQSIGENELRCTDPKPVFGFGDFDGDAAAYGVGVDGFGVGCAGPEGELVGDVAGDAPEVEGVGAEV